jgi:hypothetical protein
LNVEQHDGLPVGVPFVEQKDKGPVSINDIQIRIAHDAAILSRVGWQQTAICGTSAEVRCGGRPKNDESGGWGEDANGVPAGQRGLAILAPISPSSCLVEFLPLR